MEQAIIRAVGRTAQAPVDLPEHERTRKQILSCTFVFREGDPLCPAEKLPRPLNANSNLLVIANWQGVTVRRIVLAAEEWAARAGRRVPTEGRAGTASTPSERRTSGSIHPPRTASGSPAAASTLPSRPPLLRHAVAPRSAGAHTPALRDRRRRAAVARSTVWTTELLIRKPESNNSHPPLSA